MVRTTIVDGMYYPDDPDDLRDTLQRAFREAPAAREGARVVVAPYGAYQLTLQYIALSLKSVGPLEPDCALLLAPPNGELEPSVLMPESDGFATPFGVLPVAQDALKRLAEPMDGAPSPFVFDEISHLQDHSIEVLLPALHYLYGPIPIIPLLVGPLSRRQLAAAYHRINAACDGRTVLTVAGANLSGFISPEEADARARKVVRLLMTGPGDEILDAMDTLENPPRSLSTLVLAHELAGDEARPAVLGRGTFETEYDGDVGSIVYASIAYLPM